MSFKENLLVKIKIKQLTERVNKSLKPVDGITRADKKAMISLLRIVSYKPQKERDLDLYIKPGEAGDKKTILVLDNELAIYNTTPQDVGLRKSPTIKEMVSFRNARKILSDSDVLVCRKEETVKRIQSECLDTLDLSFTELDIRQIENDASIALQTQDTEGIFEGIMLFSELLRFTPVKKSLQISNFYITGKISETIEGKTEYSSILLFSEAENTVMLLNKKIKSGSKDDKKLLVNIANGTENPHLKGKEVFEHFSNAVFNQPEK